MFPGRDMHKGTFTAGFPFLSVSINEFYHPTKILSPNAQLKTQKVAIVPLLSP